MTAIVSGPPEEVKESQTRVQGLNNNVEKLKESCVCIDVPDDIVSNKEEWARVWKKFRENEKLPEIDFSKELVLIIQDSIGEIDCHQKDPDNRGNLSTGNFLLACSFHPLGGCGYEFRAISRAGIKTINGKPIRKD